MLLSTRINLLVISVFLIVCSFILVASLEREELINKQYSSTLISERATVWNKLVEGQLSLMENNAPIILNSTLLIESLLINDPVLILKHSQTIAKLMIEDRKLIDRLEIIYPDGSLAYSSDRRIIQDSIISTEKGTKNIEEGNWIRGIGNDNQRNIAIILGIPLYISTGNVNKFVGMAIYAKDIIGVISELENMTNSDILIVNQRGRFLSGYNSALWESIKDSVRLDEFNALQFVELDGRVYSIAVLPHETNYGNLAGRLVSIKDTTDAYRDRQFISQSMIFIVIFCLALISIALGYYLSRLFLPLKEGVEVLNALSSGNLELQMTNFNNRDEVGRIASAVNVFRAHFINFEQFRKSRQRQRKRQERFIRKEMNNLADTLDDDARADMLNDLDQLGQEDAKKVLTENEDMADPKKYSAKDSNDLRVLASAFQKMSARIQSQNQGMRDALKTKIAFSDLQGELSIAAQAQLSFLPPPMPPTDYFHVAGSMKPAKEVGGDFYDFFRIDDNRIGIVVADVSGKGVSAALFMVMARTFLQSTAKYVFSPAKMLENLNLFLERNNDEQLFITVFYAVFDERNGRFTYANGGHNPPILRDGTGIKPLPLTDGVLLGMFDDMKFDESYVDLRPGSRVVMFTDGVTEAFNENDEAFSDKRLLQTIHSLPDKNISSTDDVNSIVCSVKEFTSEASQFYDITCVVLLFKDYTEGPPEVFDEGLVDESTQNYDDEESTENAVG